MKIQLHGSSAAQARIMDMRGAIQGLIPMQPSTDPSIRIPDLAPGPYLISIEQKGQAPVIAKFIVTQ